MFPPSLGHTLNGNTFGDTQGGFLSNNKTRISICVGSASKRALKARRRPSAAPSRESPRIPIAHINELSFVRSRVYGSELVASDGYHIHTAKYQGKVVAVKVYQGMDSTKRLEADLKITSSLLHPTMLRPVAVLTATATPFIVLAGDSSPMIPRSLGGFKSLTCCLADALNNSEIESLMLGAQLIRDVSSGLDYISSTQQTTGISRLTFDLLVDENDNICITVGLEEEDETRGQGYLDVFHKLCSKNLLEANNECHLDKSQAPPTKNSASGSSSHPDLRFSPPEDEPVAETDFQSDCPPTPPRREYAFVPDHSHQSLREISTSYARFMRIITKKIQRLRRKGRGNSTMVAHRCPGYRRDEVTLSTSVLRTAIIQHLTPSPREICPICQQLVEDGTFNCFCGQEDDGSSPTIQCSRCLVWSHHWCQRNDSGADHQPFTCFFCQESNNLQQNTPISPRTVTFGQQIRKSTSKDQSLSSISNLKVPKSSPIQPEAVNSASSLASLSSAGSVRNSGMGQSGRLTPSSIPFFRRTSPQSILSHRSSAPAGPSSPARLGYKSPSLPNGFNPPSTSVPGSAHKKSSMLSQGALLKQLNKEDKDRTFHRSESRISVLMGRKRGKILSSTGPKRPKSPINLPPMQMSALEPVTAQRVARLKVSTSASTSLSRLTSQSVSSMPKQSDTSLRSTRNHLPTIAGSPSVGTNLGLSTLKELPSFMLNTDCYPKGTPTKIPRISNRSPAVSPSLKGSSSSVGANRRASTITNNNSSLVNPSPTRMSTNEFGVIENGQGHPSKTVAAKANGSVRESLSMNSTPRLARQPSTSIGSALPRESNRDSISFSGLWKSSTGSVASVATSSATTEGSTRHRFSALSPSKGLKLLSPKIFLPTARLSSNSSTRNIHQTMNSPSSSRQSLSTPSLVPSSVDDEEVAGDEEMMHYIRRQQAKKMASGATQEELDELLNFPEPIPPAVPYTPQAGHDAVDGQSLMTSGLLDH